MLLEQVASAQDNIAAATSAVHPYAPLRALCNVHAATSYPTHQKKTQNLVSRTPKDIQVLKHEHYNAHSRRLVLFTPNMGECIEGNAQRYVPAFATSTTQQGKPTNTAKEVQWYPQIFALDSLCLLLPYCND